MQELQGEAINGLKRELEVRGTFKMGDKLTLYDQFMVSSNVSDEVLAKRFNKLSLLCHPDLGCSHDVFVWLQRAHRILSDPEARLRYEAEGFEAAEEFLSLKKAKTNVLRLFGVRLFISSKRRIKSHIEGGKIGNLHTEIWKH